MAFIYKEAANKVAAISEANNATSNDTYMVVYQDIADGTHGIIFGVNDGAGFPDVITVTEAAESEHLIDALIATANVKLSLTANGVEKVSVTKQDLIDVLGDALSGKQDAITALTAFNKDFGTTAGTVADGKVVADIKAITDGLPTSYSQAPDNAEANIAPTKIVIDALGVNAATVNGKSVEENVPVGAVFTDTNTHQDISLKADLVGGKVPAHQLPTEPDSILTTEEIEHVQDLTATKSRDLTVKIDQKFKHKKKSWQTIDPFLSIYTNDKETYVKYHSPVGLGYPNSVTLWYNINGKLKDDKDFDYKDSVENDTTVTDGDQHKLPWFHVKAWFDKNIDKGDKCEMRVYLVDTIDGAILTKNYVIVQEHIGANMIESHVQTTGSSLVSDEVLATNGGVYN